MNESISRQGKVLHNGLIDLSKLAIITLNQPVDLGESVEKEISDIWNVASKKSGIFNGIFFRLLEFNFPNSITVSKTDYRTIFGLLTLGKLIQVNLSQISLGATIRTQEGMFIVGVRPNGIADLVGGGLQPESETLSSGVQITEHMLQEMNEEIGIKLKVEDVKCVGLIKDLSLSSNALFHFDVQLEMSAVLIEENFKRNASSEFSKLSFLTKSQYRDFLNQRGGYRTAILELKELDLS